MKQRGEKLPAGFPLTDTAVLLNGYNVRLMTIDERIDAVTAELRSLHLQRDRQQTQVIKLIQKYHDEGRAQ